MVSNQANFSPAKFKEILVPYFGEEIQLSIDKSIWESFDKHRMSKEIYAKAQILLLSELGLANWKPKHHPAFVKSYSDTKQAGRIDADYFQPKYDEIINSIKSYSEGWDMLGNLARLKDKNFNPQGNKEYRYIELANIAGNGEIMDCMLEQGQDLPSRARRRVATGDVIVSSIEGSLDSIALIDEEYDEALCSTGFHVINSQVLNPETLLTLLKSIVGQLQLKKGCSGTILTAINKHELCNIVLPVIPKEKQTQIQKKVIESFNLRKQSKHLPECAKRAVEIAIEQNEKVAIGWLENETKSQL